MKKKIALLVAAALLLGPACAASAATHQHHRSLATSTLVFAAGLHGSLRADPGHRLTRFGPVDPVYNAYGLIGAVIHPSTLDTYYSDPTYGASQPLGSDMTLSTTLTGVASGHAASFYLGDSARYETFRVYVNDAMVTVSWQGLRPSDNDVFIYDVAMNSASHSLQVQIHMAPGSAHWSTVISIDGVHTSSGQRTASGVRTVGHDYDTVSVLADGAAVADVEVSTQ